MSKIIELPKPFLSVSAIQSLRGSLILLEGGSGWLLSNRLPEEIGFDYRTMTLEYSKILIRYVDDQKAKYQLACIVDRLNMLKSMLDDFAKSEFQKYIDEIDEFGGEPDSFDPYEELERYMSTDGISDLPDSIERFAELLTISHSSSILLGVERDLFGELFKDVGLSYMFKDESGENIFIPQNEIPSDELSKIKLNHEIKEESQAIDDEHCLDNYNSWYAVMCEMIKKKKPFSEMLKLFK